MAQFKRTLRVKKHNIHKNRSFFKKKFLTSVSLKMAERSEAKCVKRSFASKIKIRNILMGSFASRF